MVLTFKVDVTFFNDMIRVAIVDDQQRIAQALKTELLEFSEIESVHLSKSGYGFVKDLAAMPPSKRPEIVLMDISMGSPDEGIHATREIKTRYPEIEVIIFSISDDDDRIFEAFQAGAHAYLLKNEKPSFVLKAILDVKNGGSQMSPSIARKAIRWLAPQPPKAASLSSSVEPLSDREREILELVGRGFTYDLVGEHLNISMLTVKKHMGNIFKKLQVSNKVEALRKADRLR